jgi:hypothetical protein
METLLQIWLLSALILTPYYLYVTYNTYNKIVLGDVIEWIVIILLGSHIGCCIHLYTEDNYYIDNAEDSMPIFMLILMFSMPFVLFVRFIHTFICKLEFIRDSRIYNKRIY